MKKSKEKFQISLDFPFEFTKILEWSPVIKPWYKSNQYDCIETSIWVWSNDYLSWKKKQIRRGKLSTNKICPFNLMLWIDFKFMGKKVQVQPYIALSNNIWERWVSRWENSKQRLRSFNDCFTIIGCNGHLKNQLNQCPNALVFLLFTHLHTACKFADLLWNKETL